MNQTAFKVWGFFEELQVKFLTLALINRCTLPSLLPLPIAWHLKPFDYKDSNVCL